MALDSSLEESPGSASTTPNPSTEILAAAPKILVSPKGMEGASEREDSPIPSAKGLGKRRAVHFEESIESDAKTSRGRRAMDRSRTLLATDNRSVENDDFGTHLTRSRRTRQMSSHPILGGKIMKGPFKKPWKESRLWPAHVCSTKFETWHTTSLTKRLRTVKMQAEGAPNFVGNAYRYKLNKPSNRQAVEGKYTIVYTRPVGRPFDPASDRRCAIFPPSEERSVKVKTFVPKDLSATRMRQLLEPVGGGVGRNFGVCFFKFENSLVNFGMYLDPPIYEARNQTPYKTTFLIDHVRDVSSKPDFNGDIYPEYARWPELMQILSKTLKTEGHTISFGMTDLEEYEGCGEKLFFGFHFIEMEFSCENPQTREQDRQLVVAVRMPEGRNNVASGFLLKQLFASTYDLAILNGDPNHLAPYEYYETNELYPFSDRPRKWPRWNPVNESDVGLMDEPLRFSATHVERHLFRVADQIEELEKMCAWLKRSMDESADITDNVDMRKFDADWYIKNRYENVKGERALLEEHSGEYDKPNEMGGIVDADAMDIQQDSSGLSSSDYVEDDDLAMIIDQISERESRGERRGEGNQLDSSGLGSSDYIEDNDMPMIMDQIRESQRCEERRS